jgi:uncharacterized protein (DUF1697 family)
MTRFVGLLRGINVGGRQLPMSAVRTVFEAEGGRNVVTYIQSGNVVFDHQTRSAATLERNLGRALEQLAGFAVPVLLRTAKQMADVVAKNPFPRAAPKQLHVVFLDGAPVPAAARSIDRDKYAPEEFVVKGREVYLLLPDGYGRAKLPAALTKLRVAGTARNWATVQKLVDLARR